LRAGKYMVTSDSRSDTERLALKFGIDLPGGVSRGG
jgi:hypothetical protein